MTSKGVLVVTGGSRGIGAATARMAAARGYDIAFTYLQRADVADALARELTAAGARALAIQADVAQEDDVMRVFTTVDRELGTLRVRKIRELLHPSGDLLNGALR